MGGIFQGITNLAGGLLGETDAQYGAKQAGNQANTYGGQAAGGYNYLQNIGAAARQPSMDNYPNLLGQFANQNGYNFQTPFGPSTPTGSNTAPAGTANLGTAQLGRANASSGYSSLGQFGQGLLGNYNSQIGGAQNSFLNASNMGGSGASPYALNTNQNQELNGQLDQISAAHKAAEQSLEQSFAKSGMLSAPGAIAAGKQQLAEHFGGLQQQARASFTENARQQQVTNAQNYLQFLQAQAGQGAAATGAGASGLESVAGASQGAGQYEQGFQNLQHQQQNAALMDLLSHMEGQNQFGTEAYAQGTSGLASLGGAQQQQANYFTNQNRQDLSGLLGLGLLLGGVTGGSSSNGKNTNPNVQYPNPF